MSSESPSTATEEQEPLAPAKRVSLWSHMLTFMWTSPFPHEARYFVGKQMLLLVFVIGYAILRPYLTQYELKEKNTPARWLEWRLRHEEIQIWACLAAAGLILLLILERGKVLLQQSPYSTPQRLKICHYAQGAFILLSIGSVLLMSILYSLNFFHLFTVPRDSKTLPVIFFSLWGLIPFLLLGTWGKWYLEFMPKLARMPDAPPRPLTPREAKWTARLQQHLDRCCGVGLAVCSAGIASLLLWPFILNGGEEPALSAVALHWAFIFMFASLITQILAIFLLRRKTVQQQRSLGVTGSYYSSITLIFVFTALAIYQTLRSFSLSLDEHEDTNSELFIFKSMFFLLVIFGCLIQSISMTFDYAFRAAKMEVKDEKIEMGQTS